MRPAFRHPERIHAALVGDLQRDFLVGGVAAWVVSERYLAPRLVGSDLQTIALAVLSGFSFFWVGFLAAWLLQLARP